MSLAQTAAPFENTESFNETFPNYNESTPIAKKRQTISHNKTQKNAFKEDSINSTRVNSVLESIHNNICPDDDSNLMGNFKPLAKPISVGTMRTEGKENMSNLSPNMNPSSIPQPTEDDDIDLQNLDSSFMSDTQVEQYYKNLGQKPNTGQKPNIDKKTNIGQNTRYQYNNLEQGSSQVLIDKLNYMINLLEEQQDERTNNATEEVVLYSFLGIFIIFIVDSFARVGKYVR